MRTDLCEQFGIDYPIFAFTPSEHVAAAVSKAGGLGVLGCVRFNDAEDLEKTLLWMDDNTDGKPYGVDIVMPMKIPTEGKALDLQEMIPQGHKDFVDDTLRKLGVPPQRASLGRSKRGAWRIASHAVMKEALNNRRLRHYGFLMPSDLDAIKRDGANRRMRKTARPVVWEP